MNMKDLKIPIKLSVHGANCLQRTSFQVHADLKGEMKCILFTGEVTN